MEGMTETERRKDTFLNSMSLVVQGQMIGSRKASITILAFERFTSGVFSEMPSQLVTSSKPPLATIPRTFVWLFSCMCP